MYKKLVCLSVAVYVASVAANASAAVINWDDGGADDLWSTPQNWVGDVLPTADDDAIIEMDPGAVIDATVTADALNVKIADAADSTGRVTMTGGSLTVHQTGGGGPGLWIANQGTGYFDMSGGTITTEHVYLPRNRPGQGYMTMSDGSITTGQSVTLGLHWGEYGELNMAGGTINVGTMFRCPDYGRANLHMTGGTINVAETFYIVRRGNSGDDNTAGHVQLDGGTITAEDFQMDPQDSGRPATMDITGGTLIVSGDKTDVINGYVTDGWITAYAGGGDPKVELIAGNTVVTATLTGSAWKPSPQNGAADVPTDTDISWSPGLYAVEHDVYFGTSFSDANTASDPDVLPGRGRQDPNIYDPGALELGKTYYWRIDEVNEAETPAVWRGKVWNFATPEYLVIDDFEDYNDWEPDRVFDTWPGGFTAGDPANGSMVGHLEAPFCEQTIVHGGGQSMPFSYDNTGDAVYSEAERTFSTAQDWTKAGVRALSLWFYGNLHNLPDEIYVAVEDSAGMREEVYYEDPNAVVLHAWQEWNIDLKEFSDAGVDLASVKKMYIGVGDREEPKPGASGELYFDDIRLYPRRCVPQYAPAGDLDGDCDVDYQDLDIMLENWLEGFVWDATGGYDGSGCLELDGAGDRVFIPAAPYPRDAFTYALWFNPNTAMGTDTGRRDFVYWTPGGPNPGARPCLVHNIDGSGRFRVSIMLDTMASDEQGLVFTDSRSFEASTWYHIAFTFDGTSTKVYVDGDLENTWAFAGTHWQRVNPGVYFGAHSGGGNAFDGRLDDIRIYDYALSATDIASLSGATGEPAPGPVAWYKLDETSSGTVSDSSGNGYNGVVMFIQPYTNPYDDNKVDLKDYVALAEGWLDKPLRPEL